MNNTTPEPFEGYLDDDFARFRAQQLGLSAPAPEGADPPEGGLGASDMFFGTTSQERRLSRAVDAEARGSLAEPPQLPSRPAPPPLRPRRRPRVHSTSRRLRRKSEGDKLHDQGATC